MVMIQGRPGRTKGTPLGGDKFKQELYMNRAEMAEMMRGLANEFEGGGRVEASYGGWTLGMTPNEPMMAEVRFDPEPGRREFEIRLTLKEFP